MLKGVYFIFRKRLPQYNSIEELFLSIEATLSEYIQTSKTELPFAGATPNVIIKNMKALHSTKCNVKHITGDVYYMALCTGRNTVITIHDIGSAFTGGIFKRFYIKLLWFWLPCWFAKKITVISEFSRQELVSLVPFAEKKIEVVYNPINHHLSFSSKEFNKSCPQILLMGTKPNKNLENSIEAIQGLDCKLVIVGSLTDTQKKKLNDSKLNYSNYTNVSYEKIVQLYTDSDILLFPSTYEGFGMPIIEAQAVGRAVITSNLGAMKEVAGENACLVNPYAGDDIKRAVLKVIQDDTYRNELIRSGRQNIKRFNLKTIAEKYLMIYNEIAAD